jgi:hypothetical protein
MAIPGFTAECSLGRTGTPYKQTRTAQIRSTGWLRMAQAIGPVVVTPLGHAQQVASTIRPDSYGRHCGIGRGSLEPPIDAVDQVCCRHDKCYCTRGYADCSCDRTLIRDMPSAIDQPGVPTEGKVKGTLIANALAADPFCLCHRIWIPLRGWTDAPFPLPGGGPLKICPFPYG